MKEASLIKLLTVAIEVEHLEIDLEHIGIAINRLDNRAYELLDIVLDELGFKPEGSVIINDEEKITNRDYLHRYFSKSYRKKDATEIYKELIQIKNFEYTLGDEFSIDPFL